MKREERPGDPCPPGVGWSGVRILSGAGRRGCEGCTSRFEASHIWPKDGQIWGTRGFGVRREESPGGPFKPGVGWSGVRILSGAGRKRSAGCTAVGCTAGFWASHPCRKARQGWGTRGFVSGRDFSWRVVWNLIRRCPGWCSSERRRGRLRRWRWPIRSVRCRRRGR